jgi:hypothetical protein
MKYIRKETLVLVFLLIVLVLSAPVCAEEQTGKGILGRFWERIRARISGQREVTVGEVETQNPEDREEKVKVKEGEKAPAEKAPAEKAPRKEKKIPSKGEMISVVKRRLEALPEIVDMIPGLSGRQKARGEGVEYYYAPPGGIAMKIEELDEKTLYSLYVKVNQQATIINTERINRQLRQQEQLRRLQEQQRIPQVPAGPPRTPPTQPPTPPVPPAQPPTTPSDRR